MSDEKMKVAIAQFLKKCNFTAQREMEKAIRNAIASGKLKGDEIFTAGMTLSSDDIGLNVTVYNKVEL